MGWRFNLIKDTRMEARIVRIQEISKLRDAQLKDFEAMHEEVRLQEANKRRQEQIDVLIKQVPLRFRNKSFDNFLVENEEQQRIKNIAVRFVETIVARLAEGACLTLSGKPGTGKTLLSLIIYQELAYKQISVRYESSLDWIGSLIQQKYQSTPAFYSHVKLYETVSFLIIDEVTESLSKDGAPTELERQMLFQIINKRYENNLCTLVITNRDKFTLNKRLGQPTVDRLYENGIVLAFEWNSYRQK